LHGLRPSAGLILEEGRRICAEEGRPFSYLDFKNKMKHGTFRNNISVLRRRGLVTTAIRSRLCFYWVTCVQKPNALWAMTNGGRGVVVSSWAGRSLLEVLKRLPFGERCVHDIRLFFEAKGVYEKILNSYVVEKTVPASNDLVLKRVDLGVNRSARVVVHKNDKVSIEIGSSLNPYHLTDEGLVDLVASLGKIQNFIEISVSYSCSIPPVSRWIVSSWHFGKDSLVEVSGKSLNLTVHEAAKVLRAYLKSIGNKRFVRVERIEKPKEDVASILSKKLEES